MGAEASSMDPKVTAEPFTNASVKMCIIYIMLTASPGFTAATVLLGTLTPSFMGIPWPRVLGLRE
jgi:hypothetical protein